MKGEGVAACGRDTVTVIAAVSERVCACGALFVKPLNFSQSFIFH